MFEKLAYIRYLTNELSTRGAVADFVSSFIDDGDNYEKFNVSDDYKKYRFYHISIYDYMDIVKEAREYNDFIRVDITITKVGYHATIYFTDDCFVILTDDTKGV